MKSLLNFRALLPLLLAVAVPFGAAEPIAVRQTQGATRGFLIIRSEQGKLIAHGDLNQVAHGDHLVSRLTFHFLDGSVDDETTVYTQRGTFRMVSDHHIQRGPFFPTATDAFVDAASGQIKIKSIDKNGKEKEESQQMTLPADVYNGMVGTALLNVPRDAAPFEIAMVTATGKGRLVKLAITPDSKAPFTAAGSSRVATIFRIRIKLGGVAGVVAPVVGKQPDDVLIWVLEGEVPAFVRAVGQLYEGGPIVSVELSGTAFPKTTPAKP